MEFLDKKIVVANLEEKLFVWTPPRTASITSHNILNKLNFRVFKFDGQNLINDPKTRPHNHSTNLFLGHENFSLITTVRNPYTLMVSKFKFWNPNSDTSVKEFSSFLETWFYNRTDELTYLSCYDYSQRVPDYLIRTESMFEDYLKIPFVINTEYYKSGELLNDCNKKINVSEHSELDWKTFYNQNTADMVFYNFVHVFELCGYRRDSWK
jgi:hypothetical protein